MKFNFDKCINNILNESLFDDEDSVLIDNNDSVLSNMGVEQTFKELLQYWDEKEWIYSKLNIGFETIDNKVILDKKEWFSFEFRTKEDYVEFVKSIMESGIQIIAGHLCLKFQWNINSLPTVDYDDFNDLQHCLEAHDIQIYSGKFNTLNGIPKCKWLSFKNSEIKSSEGLPEGITQLKFYYYYKIDSINDWSYLPESVKLLTVYYSHYDYVTIDHLLHLGGFDTRVLFKECRLFPDTVPTSKKRFFKNYIKNVFIDDNPNMNKKDQNEIIKHLQKIYHPIGV